MRSREFCGPLDQRRHLGLAEGLGQGGGQAGAVQQLGRVIAAQALARQEAEELPHGGEFSRLAAG